MRIAWSISLFALLLSAAPVPQEPKQRAALEGHTAPVKSVAFSLDGKTLASGSEDQTIKLWDVATGKEKATLKGHTGPVHSVIYSPDGKTLASGSNDNTVEVWSVVYSPDGKMLASAGGDKKILLWDVDTGK